MPLEIRNLEEADFNAFVDILIVAFDAGITAYLTTQPVTKEQHREIVERHLKSSREEPDCHYLKVVDTDQNDRMISAAKWRINDKERTLEQIQSMLPVPGKKEEGRPAAQDFMNYLHRVRLEFMGTKPFAFLQLLITDPAQQRRGAGSLLIRWGTQLADEKRLKCFLEASPAGRALYARHGFEPVNEEIFDLSRYGGQGSEVNTAMIRPVTI